MLIIPLTVALAGGILLAALVWDAAGPWCHWPILIALHDRPLLFYLITALALAPLPLIYLNRTRILVRRLAVVLYVFVGIGLYVAHPFTPCLPNDHVGQLVLNMGERGEQVVVTGVVVGWPEVRARDVRYRLRVEEIRWRRRRAVHGIVLVRAPRVPLYRYGDRVRVVGRLSLPPTFEDFDYRRYLAREGIHAVMKAHEIVPLDAGHGSPFWRALYTLRERASTVIDATLPEPYAALANGILLGIESTIPRALYDDFNATGTSHIIVISGFNIAIVTGLFMALFAPWLGQKRASGVAVVGIGLYVLLVGADAAVVRAGIMGGIWALSHIFGRRTQALNSLFASAFLMLALNPLTLWDVGFQLSFLATLGLIVIVPLLESPFREGLARLIPLAWRGPAYDLFHEAVVVTLAAQITTTPLIVTTFGRVSLISLLANALILSVQPLIMLGAGVSTLIGMVWLPLGKVLALIPLLPLMWTVKVVQVMARWPGASITAPNWVRNIMPLFYMGLAAYLAGMYGPLIRGESFNPFASMKWRVWPGIGSPPFRWGRMVALGAVGLPLLVTVTDVFTPTFTLLQGGDVLVRPHAGVAVLFPAQPKRPTSPMPSMVSQNIWVLTHTDTLSLARLRLLQQRILPRLVIAPLACVEGAPCPEALRLYLAGLDARGIPRASLAPGQWGTLGRLRFAYLLPADPPVEALPLVIRLDGVEFLLPPDMPLPQQKQVAEMLPPAGEVPRVLPLPLPEGGTWPDPTFLQALRPALLLLPEGATYPPAAAHAVQRFPTWVYDPQQGITLRVRNGEVTPLSAPR